MWYGVKDAFLQVEEFFLDYDLDGAVLRLAAGEGA